MSDLIQIVLASRSIGGNYGQAASAEHHAALIVNCGSNGLNEHWICQGGPQGSALVGAATKASSAGWYSDFSKAKGAYWDRPDLVRELPVTTIMNFQWPRGSLSGAFLQQQATALNGTLSGSPYNYQSGPNSNSWVKLLMQRLGLSTTLPGNAPILKAWAWQ